MTSVIIYIRTGTLDLRARARLKHIIKPQLSLSMSLRFTAATLCRTLPKRVLYQTIATRTFATAMPGSITDVITHDHAELDEYYHNILNAKDKDTKVRWQNQFVWELARHSIAEELVVYPAMEKFVQNGKQMADNDRAQHNEVGVDLALEECPR